MMLFSPWNVFETQRDLSSSPQRLLSLTLECGNCVKDSDRHSSRIKGLKKNPEDIARARVGDRSRFSCGPASDRWPCEAAFCF